MNLKNYKLKKKLKIQEPVESIVMPFCVWYNYFEFQITSPIAYEGMPPGYTSFISAASLCLISPVQYLVSEEFTQ